MLDQKTLQNRGILSTLIMGVLLYCLLVMPMLFAVKIILLFFPDSSLFNVTLGFLNLETNLLIFLCFLLPSLIIILSLLNKGEGVSLLFKLDKERFGQYSLINLFLAYIIWKEFSVLSSLNYLGLVIDFAVLGIFSIPIMNFIDSIDWVSVKHYLKTSSPFEILVSVLLTASLINVINPIIAIRNNNLIRQSRSPLIKKAEPEIIYYATKVVIDGKNFGWRDIGTKDRRIYCQYGEIVPELWTGSKIIFTAPLGWKEGDLRIWVEIPVEWGGKTRIVKSNSVTIKLISRDNGWDQEDDQYFDQLTKLQQETLMINGYESNK